jgi:hypothetical protein
MVDKVSCENLPYFALQKWGARLIQGHHHIHPWLEQRQEKEVTRRENAAER